MLVVWSTAVLAYLSVHLSTLLSSVRLYALFYPHCRRRCCGPLGVAFMSAALVSGAHEKMPKSVVDYRWVVFLSFTSSQVVYVNATACLRTTSNIYKIILFFRDSIRSFLSSRPKYTTRETGILVQIASFERRLRGAAPTPLALPCPFRTSTWTRMDGCRARRARSCKNIACRGGIPEILVVS